MDVVVIETPNPTPQSGGPRVMFTLYDRASGNCVSREGKQVSGHGAPLFENETGAQLYANELNGPAVAEDWEMSR